IGPWGLTAVRDEGVKGLTAVKGYGFGLLIWPDEKKTASLTVRTDPTIRLRRKNKGLLFIGGLILGFLSISLVIVSGRSETLIGQGPYSSCLWARIPFHGRQLSHEWRVEVACGLSASALIY
nr:hypothetical protein [Tanacetum cinerariifolium]